MQLKIFLYRSFFVICILVLHNNVAFGFSHINRNYIKNNLNIGSVKKFIFLKKNECFYFFKFNKKFFLKKEKIIISNNDYFGVFNKNKFRIFYIVKPKDTLYSIAKNSGHDYHELSLFNSIRRPYKIIVGQKIWVGDFFINQNKYNCLIQNLKQITNKKNNSCQFFFKAPLNILNFFKQYVTHDKKSTRICFLHNITLKKNNNFIQNRSFIFSNHWYWPIKSNRIQYFYNSNLSDKKIEISGIKGQPIFAAAPGEVIFVTNLFKKYGKLIIIRHNKNYLSIYAFNNSILVKKNDQVYANQNIATMGLSPDNNLVRLYFEIRFQGKSINPLNMLPQINRKK